MLHSQGSPFAFLSTCSPLLPPQASMELEAVESTPPLHSSQQQKCPRRVKNVVMVVIDASKRLNSSSLSAIDWAFNSLIQSGDSLSVLGVLHQTYNAHILKKASELLGYRPRADLTSHGGFDGKVLQEEVSRKKEEIRRNIMEIHNGCLEKGVKLDVLVKPGFVKLVAIHEAVASGTTHVVLGSHVGKYYKLFSEQLSCNVYQMKHKNLTNTLEVNTSLGSTCNEVSSQSDHCVPMLSFSQQLDILTCNAEVFGGFSMEVEGNSDSSLKMLSNMHSNIKQGHANHIGNGIDSLTFADYSNLDGISCNTSTCLGSNSGDSMNDLLMRQHSADITEGEFTSCSPSAGLNAASSLLTITQKSSSSPTCSELCKNRCITTRRNSNTQSLNSLSNHNEASGNLLSFSDMHQREIKHAFVVETSIDSLVDATKTQRIKPFSSMEVMAVVSDHALQQTSPLRNYEHKHDQSSIMLTQLRELPRLPCQRMRTSRRLSSGKYHLCSVCKQRTPEFGRMLKRFTYAEIESATDHFSHANFLAKGGFGLVYRGMFHGQFIAVKQHKMRSSQGEKEFCAEIELLSCAQHRNLVMLLGYCDEKNEQMLVYEYVCNRSLEWHLLNNRKSLNWSFRYKIALGAARALRYLHEECRVGCIAHRDMRPSNILLTHEFEPMVGDFGLARSLPNGDMLVETCIIGTFGYLAPEYVECGQISWRGDIYSFGVVLLELITGCKAIDFLRECGQQILTEWARPILNDQKYKVLLDSSLGLSFDENQLYCMARAASLCIRKDPLQRPRMSQILHILEGQHMEIEDSPQQSFFMGRTSILHLQSQSMQLSLRNSSIYTALEKSNFGNKTRKAKLSYTEML